MDDLISRKALCDYALNQKDKSVTPNDIMRFPSAQPEPKWIPVSERLPETEEFVLASLTGKYRNITFEHACEIADYADGGWCVYAYPHMSAEKCEELIEAWMPLPKPFGCYVSGIIKPMSMTPTKSRTTGMYQLSRLIWDP